MLQAKTSTLQFSRRTPLSRQDSSRRTTFDPSHVRDLFDRIAPRYDFLNHLLSSGIDVLWRKKAIALLRPHNPLELLDVATGTGDLAFEAVRQLRPHLVTGIDVSPAMLNIGRSKAAKMAFHDVKFTEASAESLPFKTGTFDAVMSGFGVRNFSDLTEGLSEMHRVLKPGAPVLILEFSRPRAFPVMQLYSLYSRTVVPAVGGFVSHNRQAYEYLPGTIREFPDGTDFLGLLQTAGFHSLRHIPLTFGISAIYYGIK